MGYRSSNKTVYSAKYHIIWCPKYRRRVLAARVEVTPAVASSKLVRSLKGRSSWLGRGEFAHLGRLPALWSPSWLISTVSGDPLGVVGRHVENHKAVA